MHWFQNTLLMIGSIALGGFTGSLGLAYLSAVTIFAPRPGTSAGESWGGYIGVIAALVVGGIVGIVLGIFSAHARIQRSRGKVWNASIWTGIAVGLAFGFALSTSTVLHRFGLLYDIIRSWPGGLALTVALATCGGGAGKLIRKMIKQRRAALRDSSPREWPTPRR